MRRAVLLVGLVAAVAGARGPPGARLPPAPAAWSRDEAGLARGAWRAVARRAVGSARELAVGDDEGLRGPWWSADWRPQQSVKRAAATAASVVHEEVQEEARSPLFRRVALLLCNTGGGHLASAQALAQAFARQVGEAETPRLRPERSCCVGSASWRSARLEVVAVDLWTEFGAWPLNRLGPLYQWCTRQPWRWGELPHGDSR